MIGIPGQPEKMGECTYRLSSVSRSKVPSRSSFGQNLFVSDSSLRI